VLEQAAQQTGAAGAALGDDDGHRGGNGLFRLCWLFFRLCGSCGLRFRLCRCGRLFRSLDGLGLVALKMPTVNCVDGSPDGVAVYEPAMGLIHNINRNEYQLAREFELGRMRIAASADLLTAENGRKRLRDDLFVGLEGSEQTVGITAFAPALRNENYEARRQAYLKAVENLLGVKRGILSDAEAVSKTATEINSSAGDYSLSIIEFQNLYYDALQAALRLADQLGQAYRLCDGTAWDTEVLNVTWGNGVLYDADKEWADRLAMVQQGMLRNLRWRGSLTCRAIPRRTLPPYGKSICRRCRTWKAEG
jgi:hypothetical protein